MSTNYSVHTPDGEEIHLGKSAAGHLFMFRGYPERGVVDYASWTELLRLGEIRTESGTPITADYLHTCIVELRRRYGLHPFGPSRDEVDDANGNRFTLVGFR